MGIIYRNWFRDSKNVPDFFTQAPARDGANATTTANVLFIPGHLSFIPTLSQWAQPYLLPCGQEQTLDSLSLFFFFFLRLFFACIDPWWFPSFFFSFLCLCPYFPLWTLLQVLAGRINHFAAKGYLLSVFINIYCYCCLLSCFFPLGIMLWFFNSAKSGRQREMHTVIKISA